MSFVRKSFGVSVGQAIVVALGFVTGILYARSLGPDGVGRYRLFCTTATIVAIVGAAGLSRSNIYFMNSGKESAERIATNAFKYSVFMGLLVFIGVYVFVRFLPGYFGQTAFPTVVLYSFGVALLLGVGTMRSLLVAELDALGMVLSELIRSILMVVAAALLFFYFHFSDESTRFGEDFAIAAWAIGVTVSLAYILNRTHRHVHLREPFNWPCFWRVLAYGIKLSFPNLLYLLSLEITVVILRLFTQDDFAAVGFYTRATAIGGLTLMIPRMLGPMLYAKWAGTSDDRRAMQAERALRLNFSYGALTTLLILIAGDVLISLMYGSEFLPAASALRILAFSMIAVSAFMVTNSLLAADGKAMLTVYAFAGTLLLICVVAGLLVPRIGIDGAAYAALVGNTFALVFTGTACVRLYGIRPLRCIVMGREDVGYLIRSLRLNRGR